MLKIVSCSILSVRVVGLSSPLDAWEGERAWIDAEIAFGIEATMPDAVSGLKP